MSFAFSQKDVDKISAVLGASPETIDNSSTWRIVNSDTGQKLVLAIYNEVDLGGGKKGPLVNAQTAHGYFELHDVGGWLPFEPDEIIFAAHSAEKTSCLIVSSGCACSMFSDIDKRLPASDFSKIDPPALMSAMQVSLAEEIFRR